MGELPVHAAISGHLRHVLVARPFQRLSCVSRFSSGLSQQIGWAQTREDLFLPGAEPLALVMKRVEGPSLRIEEITTLTRPRTVTTECRGVQPVILLQAVEDRINVLREGRLPGG